MTRLAALWLAVTISSALVVVRLVDLQVIRGAHFLTLAEHNRLRVVAEEAPRGLILDRRGNVLASNHTVFHATVVPQDVEQLDTILARVQQVTGVPMERLKRAWRLHHSLPFVPATIAAYLPKAKALQLEEDRFDLPGLLVRAETIRDYPQERLAAHLLGYLGQPTAEELPALKQYGVQPEHLIGQIGLERSLEAYLRGESGGEVVEVDHRTRAMRTVGHRQPQSGEPVKLTLDSPLQSLIERAFGDQPGAAVVLDPQTGEVLAMVSVPAFSPAAFVSGPAEEVSRYLNDPGAPLMNRATMGTYTPGSIAKLITASAALEHGLITPSHTIVCTGSVRIGDRTFHCWNRDGHGALTLPDAIAVSCNVYFMTLARQLGAHRLIAAMSMMGWGKPTGWPLEEHAGHLPKRQLTEGEVGMLGIGQGELLITPLQAAVMVSAIANGGWLVTPWVVKGIGKRHTAKTSVQRLGWSAETLKAVRTGMRQAVDQPLGTASRARTPSITVAGKTGTAQTQLEGRPHGWFIGFCPADEPRVAMAIVVEHGGSGGDLPAEIGRTVCEYIGASEESG